MSDLYTSQVHLKRLLAGQATAAFTPAPDAVLKMLDPAFFPGMGALNEDEHGRLQCPVRGCGKWFPNLGAHIAASHKGFAGGRRGIIAALSLAPNVPLMSAAARAHHRATVGVAARAFSVRRGGPAFPVTGGAVRKGKSYPTSIAQRNFADSCPAQLQAKIESLDKTLGRTPTANDFRRTFGTRLLAATENYFGTWNAAKAACGLTLLTSADGGAASRRLSISNVVVCLSVWHTTHGDLPSAHDVAIRDKRPYIPCYRPTCRAFGVNTWPAAMRSAGEYLGIKSERYGFDFRKKGKT